MEIDMRKITLCRLAATGLGFLLAGTAASGQDVVRVRGSIEPVDGTAYVVRARDGAILKLTLANSASVAASVKVALSDIKRGSYVGVAALPQADGSLRALEVHIFDVVNVVESHVLTLKYKEGEQRIIVPPGTIIVAYLPGRAEELAPGATIFVPAANRQPDGTLQAQRVMVGRDVPPPQ